MKHIDSVAELSTLAVDKATFYASLHSGQILFSSGKRTISHAIEKCTGSPWSHIGMVYMPCFEDGTPIGVWMIIEAVWPHGVGTNLLTTYIEGPDDLVLCHRVDKDGALVDERPAIKAGLLLSGRDYAAFGLVRAGLHRLDKKLPAEWNQKEVYCSGAIWLESLATNTPLSAENGAPAPEDEWLHWSMVADAALSK